jgi:hypothetical protein
MAGYDTWWSSIQNSLEMWKFFLGEILGVSDFSMQFGLNFFKN